jgi:hypothetical protein
MASARTRDVHFVATVKSWWRNEASQIGNSRTFWLFLSLLWQFLRDSTPSRRKQRYGDVDFDWDYRVDTTGATVGWRDRFLGLFHSPYQPTDPALFREMLAALKINLRGFTFIDVGSGKGRVLLMAAGYPFQRILGIELFPALHGIAEENVRNYKSETQQCFVIESVCEDARRFEFPPEPALLYLFNPLPEAGFREMLDHLEQSLLNYPRPFFVLYHNPLLEHVLSQRTVFKKIAGTHQYCVYEFRS